MIVNLAHIYAGFVVVVILFQLALIAGAPWGALTQGGRFDGRLPASGRIAAGVSIPILLFMAAAIQSGAGLAPNWPAWTGWLAVGLQALTTLFNAATPSAPERRLWGPVTMIMFGLTLVVMSGIEG